MNKEFDGVWEHMRSLGLAALAHANRHAAYFDPANCHWSDLSVLQAAHAAEIIIKARIAQEHPLLIFEEFPKFSSCENSELTLRNLFEKGQTIQWHELPTRLWAATGIKIPNQNEFVKFGKLRNGIQHFVSAPIDSDDMSRITLQFVFDVIDPFINECWGLFAIDYDEDYDSYENFPPTLIRNEIRFLVSPEAVEHYETWNEDLNGTSREYQKTMLKRIRIAINTKDNE